MKASISARFALCACSRSTRRCSSLAFKAVSMAASLRVTTREHESKSTIRSATQRLDGTSKAKNGTRRRHHSMASISPEVPCPAPLSASERAGTSKYCSWVGCRSH